MRAAHILNPSYLLLATLASGASNEPATEPDLYLALTHFREAEEVSQRDAGKLWHRPLYGPMLFVDPLTRRLVANQADNDGHLSPRDGVFVGELPGSVNVANTATKWAGTRWTMILWPLPEDELRRCSLLMHESFHRIQDELGLPATNPGNEHLDTMDGRLWLQLEWRALGQALTHNDDNRDAAVADALVFRAWRRALFPDADAGETALEINEGMAEYTGLKLCSSSASTGFEMALDGLDRAPTKSSFVRSFAYASGPAYGLLLDLAAPSWRQRLAPDADLGELLRKSSAIDLPRNLEDEAERRALSYSGDSLRKAEAERDQVRREWLAVYRARFIEGPVLMLPMAGETNFSFNPNEMVPLEGHGTVYVTLRVTDAWGVLEASDGALMSFETGEIRLEAPAATDLGARPLIGPGWELELSEGWEISVGPRHGDYRLGEIP